MGIYAECQQLTAAELAALRHEPDEDKVRRFLADKRQADPGGYGNFDKDFGVVDAIITQEAEDGDWTISEGGTPLGDVGFGYGAVRFVRPEEIGALLARLEPIDRQAYWRRWCAAFDLDPGREPQPKDFERFDGTEEFASREAFEAELKYREHADGYEITWAIFDSLVGSLRRAAAAGDALLFWIS